MSIMISIIVPIYNVEKYLEECVKSLVGQSYKNIEIILVDDGSLDSSGEICDKWKKKDERIVVLHKANGGLSDARNAGIEIASGEYLMFVDSDDYVDYLFCENALSIIGINDIGVFNYYKVNKEPYKESEIEQRILKREEAMKELVSGNISDYAWNKIYKRELFDDVKYPIGKVWEDIGTTYRLFDKANTISFSNTFLYYYRVREGSISNMLSGRALIDIFEHIYNQHVFCCKKYPMLVCYTEKRIREYAILCFMKNYDRLKILPRYEIQKNILLKEDSFFDIGKSLRTMIFVYRKSEWLFKLVCLIKYKVLNKDN